MALVSNGFWLTVTLADNGDNRSTLEFQGDSAILVDFATALTQSGNLITDLDALSQSVIVGYNVAERFYNDSIALPAGLVENENKASITYSIDGTNKKGNLKIPAPVPTVGVVFVGASGASANQVQVNSTEIQAYFDNFRTSGGFLISDGEKANQVLVGKRISAKNNNG